MPNARISINNPGDPPSHPANPDEFIWLESPDIDFTILNGGMESGKQAVVISFMLPDGKRVHAQTTAAIIEGLYHACKGAQERYVSAISRDGV